MYRNTTFWDLIGRDLMRTLLVHPSGLMYSEIFLRLEPLGLERVAAAARTGGHDVRLLAGSNRAGQAGQVDRARLLRVRRRAFGVVHRLARPRPGGRRDGRDRAGGRRGRRPPLLDAARDGDLHKLPGVVTAAGTGPAPRMLDSIDDFPPARDLTRRRNKYFIGTLDPCASVEFTRGCPWDCSFCSAWTFYGRSYRRTSPAAAAAEVASIREPGVFIVDDVAFIRSEHGHAIAAGLEKRRVRKKYHLETRSDVLLRNTEVFRRWRWLGLDYMFLGMEAMDEEGLAAYRKRVSLDDNIEALETARRLKMDVAINLIVDPAWDVNQFKVMRAFAESVPEIVHLSVMTPYPGTEIWSTAAQNLTTLDYRLFDIQHAVLPTTLPLPVFYAELVKTQAVINRKHLGVAGLAQTAGIAARLLLHGQTNFVRILWRSARSTTATGNSPTTSAPSTTSFPRPARYPSPPDGASSTCTKTVRAATVPMPRSPPAPTRADRGTGCDQEVVTLVRIWISSASTAAAEWVTSRLAVSNVKGPRLARSASRSRDWAARPLRSSPR
jgi:magnesium-protoporphyrin IX monomethyl ester (oxidative) cyclase